MHQQTPKRLYDLLLAAESVQRFTTGKTLADFLGDEMLRAAVYYQFAVIGEALTQVRKVDAGVAAQITEHDRIIGFRNQVVHGYDRLDDEITWQIVENKVPVLLDDLKRLLSA